MLPLSGDPQLKVGISRINVREGTVAARHGPFHLTAILNLEQKLGDARGLRQREIELRVPGPVRVSRHKLATVPYAGAENAVGLKYCATRNVRALAYAAGDGADFACANLGSRAVLVLAQGRQQQAEAWKQWARATTLSAMTQSRYGTARIGHPIRYRRSVIVELRGYSSSTRARG
jgi:hypothetical protein